MVTPDQSPEQGVRMPATDTGGLDQPFSKGGLVSLRAAVAAHGSRLGLAGERLDDLLLVAHELASNAIQHGGGRGQLRLRRQEDVVACQVDDWGDGLPDGADAGLLTPTPGALRGRGLWLVRQLADEIEVRSGATGTSVIARIEIRPPV